jgi:PiT family inorganic phosphate transporter
MQADRLLGDRGAGRVLALAFDFMNGFHDAANSIATVVSTGVLKPQQAVALPRSSTWWRSSSSSSRWPATIGKGIAEPGVIDHHVVFGALIGAITWNVITWWYGIPSSSLACADRRHRRRGRGQGRHRAS